MTDDTVTPFKVHDAPALGFSLQIGIGKDRQIVFQSHLDQDAPLQKLNLLLDKINAAADRQIARTAIEDHKRLIAQREAALRNLKLDFVMIEERERLQEAAWNQDSRRHGNWKRDDKQDKHRQEMLALIDRYEQSELPELHRQLAEIEKAANAA